MNETAETKAEWYAALARCMRSCGKTPCMFIAGWRAVSGIFETRRLEGISPYCVAAELGWGEPA